MNISIALLISTTCQRLGLGLYIFALLGVTFWQADISMPLVALLALITLGVGGLASMAHLGRPQRFLNSFANWRSHLTQEALITPFLGLALLIAALDGSLANLGWLGSLARWAALFLSLAFLVCTGLVYQLSARPAWNTPLVLIIFLATAAATGSLAAAAFDFGNFVLPLVALLSWLVCCLAQYLFIQRLKQLGYGVAVEVTAPEYRNLFWLWLATGVVAPPLCIFSFSACMLYVGVLFSLVGILAWTGLFYRTSLLARKFPMYPVDLNTYF